MRGRGLLGCAILATLLARAGMCQPIFQNEMVPLTAQLPGGGTASPGGGILVDLDQDGDVDLVGFNVPGSLLVFRAVGGTFPPGVAYPILAAQALLGAAAGDLDGDGDQDVAAVGHIQPQTYALLVFLNDGTGAFPTSPLSTPLPIPYSIRIGHLNADAIPDLVLSSPGAPLAILAGVGSGNFTPPLAGPTMTSGASFVIYDDDLDGVDDLHEVAPYGFVTYRNNGLGVFAAPLVRFPVFGTSVVPRFVDVDLDGNADVALVGSQPSGSFLQVAFANGAGSWTPGAVQTLAPTTGFSPTAFADFDGDGDADLVGRLGLQGPYYASNLGSSFNPAVAVSQNVSGAMLVGDVTGDGLADVFYLTEGQAVVQRARATIGLEQPTIVAVATGGLTFEIADLDANGLLDAVVGFGSNLPPLSPRGIAVYMNVEAAPAPSLTFTGTADVTDVVTGDWNRDGLLDVLAARHVDCLMFLGTPGGAFSAPSTVAAGIGSDSTAVAADVDRDGNLDVVLTHSWNVTVLLGDGAGGFGGPLVTAICPNAITGTCLAQPKMAVGDLDADGYLDLVVTIPSLAFLPASLSVFLGNGTGFFTPLSASPCVSSTFTPRIADVNGDHVLDLVISAINQTTSIEVRLGLGGGAFGAPVSQPIVGVGNYGWGGDVELGDVDGDGFPDVVFSGGAVRLNDGAGGFIGQRSLLFEGSSQVALADCDHDLQRDAVLFQPAAGKLAIFHQVRTCSGQGFAYGLGCPGSGGFVPRLSASGCAAPGGTLILAIDRALGGSASAALVVAAAAANVSVGSGCTALVDLASSFIVPLTVTGPAVAGQGRCGLTVLIPPSVPAGTTVAIQGAIADPASPFQWSATPGVGLVLQ